jgi:hypothetical protein
VTHDLGYRDIRRLQESSYDEIKSQAKEPAQKKPQPNPTIRHDVLESKGKKKANTHNDRIMAHKSIPPLNLSSPDPVVAPGKSGTSNSPQSFSEGAVRRDQLAHDLM